MKSPKISAAIATFNEEQNIQDCIDSLKQFAQEIIVVDGSSTDRTAQIAKNAGAKVIKTTNKKMFHRNKNLAIEKCIGEWIFLIDADERISKELSQEIVGVTAANPVESGYWVPRANWFLGGFLKKGGAYPDSVIRLFRKGKAKLPEVSVHEQVKVEGKVGKLKNSIVHFADPDFSRYLQRADRYTQETADKLKQKDTKKGTFSTIYYSIILPMLIFAKLYLRHKGYTDGFRGFVWAFFSAFHYYFAFVKYSTEKK